MIPQSRRTHLTTSKMQLSQRCVLGIVKHHLRISALLKLATSRRAWHPRAEFCSVCRRMRRMATSGRVRLLLFELTCCLPPTRCVFAVATANLKAAKLRWLPCLAAHGVCIPLFPCIDHCHHGLQERHQLQTCSCRRLRCLCAPTFSHVQLWLQ